MTDYNVVLRVSNQYRQVKFYLRVPRSVVEVSKGLTPAPNFDKLWDGGWGYQGPSFDAVRADFESPLMVALRANGYNHSVGDTVQIERNFREPPPVLDWMPTWCNLVVDVVE